MNEFLEFRRQYNFALKCLDSREFTKFSDLTNLDIVRILKKCNHMPISSVKGMLRTLYKRKKVGYYEVFKSDSIDDIPCPDFSKYWAEKK